MANRIALTQPRSQLLYAYPLASLQSNPYYYSRMNELAGRNILNLVTGQTIANAYSASGITYGIPGGFANDPSTAIQNNGSGSVTLPFITAQIAEFTLMCRIKLFNANSSGFALHVGIQGTGYGFGIGGTTLDNAGTQLIGASDNHGWLVSGAFLSIGTWHHCAMVDTGGNILFYVDGALMNTQLSGGFNAPTTNNYFGSDGVGRNSNFALSDGAFYNYPLNSTQIAALALLAN